MHRFIEGATKGGAHGSETRNEVGHIARFHKGSFFFLSPSLSLSLNVLSDSGNMNAVFAPQPAAGQRWAGESSLMNPNRGPCFDLFTLLWHVPIYTLDSKLMGPCMD